MLLALGLNVAVGWAGPARPRLRRLLRLRRLPLRDARLGPVRPALAGQCARSPIVIVATALLGLLLGLPSRRLARRLPRDRDALLRCRSSSSLRRTPTGSRCRGTTAPTTSPAARTGSPTSTRSRSSATSSSSIDAATSGSRSASSRSSSSALCFVNESRTGRAWRALREDPLAAELMSMPVNRLKLLAFMFGAGVGRAHRARSSPRSQRGVFPVELRPAAADHGLRDGDPRRRRQPRRASSLGAIVINVSLEAAARRRSNARWLFYVALVLALLVA